MVIADRHTPDAGSEGIMNVVNGDPLLVIADRVTYCLSECGYAFIEDDKVDALADTLKAFLKAAGIPINEAEAAPYLAEGSSH
jgi:glyoxylate utilization-related uncharacterized protein